MILRRLGHGPARRLVRLALLALLLPAACEVRRRLPPAGEQGRDPARPALSVGTTSGALQPAWGTDGVSDPAPRVGDGSFEPTSPPKVSFAVIGDYGWAGPAERQVAELVDALQPDFVITTGDNNYPLGAASTIDANIGQYFSELIHPYRGEYGSSATENRFFPVLGNHDWNTPGAEPYLAYFTLPGNERYYDVVRGDVHFFAVDSDEREPDGIGPSSIQALWLKQGLEASTTAFNVVAMHHPPYSSGPHGSTVSMQWPYAEWGADLVLAGHDHGYERLLVGGLTYVVSGLGGASIYSFGDPVDGSIARYNEHYGLTLLEADAAEIRLSFFGIDGELVDTTRLLAHR